MSDNKRILIAGIIIAIVAVISSGVYFYNRRNDDMNIIWSEQVSKEQAEEIVNDYKTREKVIIVKTSEGGVVSYSKALPNTAVLDAVQNSSKRVYFKTNLNAEDLIEIDSKDIELNSGSNYLVVSIRNTKDDLGVYLSEVK